MAIFERVRLEADKENFPVLLANGNLVEEGDVVVDNDNDNDENQAKNQRHYAVWSDPFPKPSYLFCCVAGNLGKIADTFTTSPSGREVTLQVYSDPKDVHKLQYAMESLKASMAWDQTRFGLEYDLVRSLFGKLKNIVTLPRLHTVPFFCFCYFCCLIFFPPVLTLFEHSITESILLPKLMILGYSYIIYIY